MEDIVSSHSADSDPDVTAYAESVVQRMENVQSFAQTHENDTCTTVTAIETPDLSAGILASATSGDRRPSTHLASDEEEAPNANLSALECALQVVTASESRLLDLSDTAQPGEAANSDSPPQANSENVSSVCDAPSLHGGECKVRFLAEESEDDGGTEQSSLAVPVALYGRHPFSHGSGTEGGDETGSDVQVPGTSSKPPIKTATTDEPPQLSGRSRAILKEYFDEAPPVRLPM